MFLIPLCLKSHGKYCFNLLSIIKLLYHFYTEHEIYNLAYDKRKGYLNDSLFIEGTIGSWDYYDT